MDRAERVAVIHCFVTCRGTDLHLSPISLFTQHQRLSFTGVPQIISVIIQKDSGVAMWPDSSKTQLPQPLLT